LLAVVVISSFSNLLEDWSAACEGWGHGLTRSAIIGSAALEKIRGGG
jgi:hypothetical protein